MFVSIITGVIANVKIKNIVVYLIDIKEGFWGRSWCDAGEYFCGKLAEGSIGLAEDSLTILYEILAKKFGSL